MYVVMQKVAVVILNFKLKEQTLKAVKSVQESSYQDLQIIVVDNNSQDGLEDEVKKLKNVEFIQSGDNLGYSGGNNLGIKKALGLGAELVFILNPDTTLEKESVETLVEGLERNEAGIVCPKIYFADSKKIWFAGGKLDILNVLGSHRGVNEKDEGQYNKEEGTDFATGAAVLIKKQVLQKVGLLDDRYFLYYEDSDICFRVKKAGFKIMYIPKAVVYHKNAQATTLGSSLQDYFITRNRMLFASKFLSFRTQFALFREALRNLGNPVRRMAFFDFLMGRFGKGSFLK